MIYLYAVTHQNTIVHLRLIADCIFFYFFQQNGEMVPFTTETDEKHSLKQIGKKFVFSVKDLSPEDAGLYQVDVEGVNIFSTDFKGRETL